MPSDGDANCVTTPSCGQLIEGGGALVSLNARHAADRISALIGVGIAMASIWGTVLLFEPPVLGAGLVPPGLSEKGIEMARTREEHWGIAEAYDRQADDLRARAASHRDMPRAYEQPAYRTAEPEMSRHCELFAQFLEAAAREARALSEGHLRMAAEAGKEAN